MEAMVQQITGVKVLTLHHDVSTVTREEVVLFTLAESPLRHDAKTKDGLVVCPSRLYMLCATARHEQCVVGAAAGTASAKQWHTLLHL
jgi:hypothetical protein